MDEASPDFSAGFRPGATRHLNFCNVRCRFSASHRSHFIASSSELVWSYVAKCDVGNGLFVSWVVKTGRRFNNWAVRENL